MKLNEKPFCAFKFFILESGLKRLKIDATTTTVNTLSKQDVRLYAGNKKRSSNVSTSVSPRTSTDTEAPSVVEKDKNEDILVAITEKGWDKTFIQSLNKEKRENAFRLMVKSHITEKRCSNPGCSFHKQKMVDLSKVDPGSLPSKLKSLVSNEEIKEFLRNVVK